MAINYPPLIEKYGDDQPLLPIRSLHNYSYCPRLCYLRWVEKLFVESADTVEGSSVHKRVDIPTTLSPEEELGLSGRITRSLELSSERLRLTGVIDLIEEDDQGRRRIIDYKKGSPWRDEQGEYCAKSFDAIQLAACALLMRDNQIDVHEAGIYYAESKKHVSVPLSDELLSECLSLIKKAHSMAASAKCPPPLNSSGRCELCSLYPICLPYESHSWMYPTPQGEKNTSHESAPLRPPMPEGDAGEILVIQNREAYISLRGGSIRVLIAGQEQCRHPVEQLQAVYLYGAIQVSAQALQALITRGCLVSYFSAAGRFIGMAHGLASSGVDARRGQYALWQSHEKRLCIASEIIRCKIHNQRVNLMRNGKMSASELRELAALRDACREQTHLDALRGLEGRAAAIYFSHFSSMIKSHLSEFQIEFRNRRPPRDPINAMLSLGYSILSKELSGIAYSVGLDPFMGFFHSPRYGRPALALDMMEEFRPLIADSVVLSLVNRGEVRMGDFDHSTRGVILKDGARRQFWRAWARRMDTEVTHPSFGYKMSYRRMMIVQMRQFWRFCRGDIEQFEGFTTR